MLITVLALSGSRVISQWDTELNPTIWKGRALAERTGKLQPATSHRYFYLYVLVHSNPNYIGGEHKPWFE